MGFKRVSRVSGKYAADESREDWYIGSILMVIGLVMYIVAWYS